MLKAEPDWDNYLRFDPDAFAQFLWYAKLATKVRLPDGSEADLVENKFEALKEEWNEYRLSDGTMVRFKVVVTAIGRVVNERGEITYNNEGVQNVVVKSTNIVHVIDPPPDTRSN